MTKKTIRNRKLRDAFVEHKDVLTAYLSRYTLMSEDIDDILQAAFLKTLEASQSRVIESPKSYLFIVARNLVFKKLREKSKRILQEIQDIDEQHLSSGKASIESNIHGKLKLHSFINAAEHLPTQCRRVFLMRKLLGMSHNEISTRLDISKSTVERHITNAIRHCRDVMRKDGYYMEHASPKLQENNSKEEKFGVVKTRRNK